MLIVNIAKFILIIAISSYVHFTSLKSHSYVCNSSNTMATNDNFVYIHCLRAYDYTGKLLIDICIRQTAS